VTHYGMMMMQSRGIVEASGRVTMISIWQVELAYKKLMSRRWRVVNAEYGSVMAGDNRLQITARDGTTLRAGIGETMHVWVTERTGRVLVRVLVDQAYAAVTDIHLGLGSAVDLVEVLTWAQHNVCYDVEEGYLADATPVGREVVIEFLREACDEVCG